MEDPSAGGSRHSQSGAQNAEAWAGTPCAPARPSQSVGGSRADRESARWVPVRSFKNPAMHSCRARRSGEADHEAQCRIPARSLQATATPDRILGQHRCLPTPTGTHLAATAVAIHGPEVVMRAAWLRSAGTSARRAQAPTDTRLRLVPEGLDAVTDRGPHARQPEPAPASLACRRRCGLGRSPEACWDAVPSPSSPSEERFWPNSACCALQVVGFPWPAL